MIRRPNRPRVPHPDEPRISNDPKLNIMLENRVISVLRLAGGVPVLRRVTFFPYDLVDEVRVDEILFEKLWTLIEEHTKKAEVV